MRYSFFFTGMVLCLLSACSKFDITSLPTNTAYLWEYEQTGTGAYDMPMTTVSLTNESGEVLYTDTCEGVATGGMINDPKVLTSVSCWFAGGGTDFAVLRADNGYTLAKRWTDEESGFGEWDASY